MIVCHSELAIAGCIITRSECRFGAENKPARHSCAGRNLDSARGNGIYYHTHENLRSILNVRDPCLRRDDARKIVVQQLVDDYRMYHYTQQMSI